MRFNPRELLQWLAEHNSRDSDARQQEKVLEKVAAQDYTLVAFKMRDYTRLPVGIRGLEKLLNGDESGFIDLHRVWRYIAYDNHIRHAKGDWVRNNTEGEIDEFSIPTIRMEWSAYSMLTAAVFGEIQYAQWCGKRLVAEYSRPDIFGPIDLGDEPIVPYAVGLFWHWANANHGQSAASAEKLLAECAEECEGPLGRVLAAWNDDRSFATHFAAMCDDFGSRFDEPLPFCGFPVAIIATVMIRRGQGLSVPDHPLLYQTVCEVKPPVTSDDPFFDRVNREVSEQASIKQYRWPW
ncbi:MAG: hypothetical protein QGG36_03290 [Pirellulaceae bacterium]|nr:hypothetical protein [Pirellulaceae bacterium]MDP7014803.1 hypothetical protein [Pirellulaceae bacterium]